MPSQKTVPYTNNIRNVEIKYSNKHFPVRYLISRTTLSILKPNFLIKMAYEATSPILFQQGPCFVQKIYLFNIPINQRVDDISRNVLTYNQYFKIGLALDGGGKCLYFVKDQIVGHFLVKWRSSEKNQKFTVKIGIRRENI